MPCAVYLTMADRVEAMNVHFVTDGPALPFLKYSTDKSFGNDTSRVVLGVPAFVPNPFVIRYCLIVRSDSVILILIWRYVSTIQITVVPDQVYYLQVGSKGELYSKVFSFRSLPSANNFTFIAGGDIGVFPQVFHLFVSYT